MARPIVLSNGEMHVGINEYGLVHDFYFPYVGLDNHAAGQQLRHRIGVWIDGTLSWLDDGSWELGFSYPHRSLIGHTTARNHELGILLEFDDLVDARHDIFIRNIHVVNVASEAREIRVFLHQAFVIGDRRSYTDTVQYLPDSEAILHYHGRRSFVVSAVHDGDAFDQYTTGLFGIEGKEGTYRDADDGELSMCAVEHGRVDSTIRFVLYLDGHSSDRIHYWIAAGFTTRQALRLHKTIQKDGIYPAMKATSSLWHQWLQPAEMVARTLPKERQTRFLQSVLLLKSHIDNRGAVIASTDSAMLNYNRDAYAYCWPRDAAYVLWPLIRLGYTEEAENFFQFCKDVMHPSGYLMHKYSADGAVGSSWHPYLHANGEVAPPIQTDETAIVLFLFAQYYQLHKDQTILHEFYDPMLKVMAQFVAEYIDPDTKLPRQSYDLWEENYMTTTYTTAVTYGGLLAASELAGAIGDEEHAVAWRLVADQMRESSHEHLYNQDRKAFRKGFRKNSDGSIEYDDTLDASALYGAFMYGLFPIGSPELIDSIQTYTDTFRLDSSIGLPRYEDDSYQRAVADSEGNPWFITTLWTAQYFNEIGDTSRAQAIIGWVEKHMSQSGILSEQIHPQTGVQVSVAPLAWSHAEYISTLLDTSINKTEDSRG